jgi:ribose transport system permease protein
MTARQRSYVRPKEVAVPYALVVLALIVGAITVPGFVSAGHLSSMSATAAYIGVIAVGQTLVLLLGGIDLSVPYTLNLAAVLLTGFQASRLSGGSSLAIVLAIGLGIGLVNGLGVALLDVPPLVMTLGMNSILQGVSLMYTNGTPVGTAPAFVTTLSTGLKGIPYVDMLWIGLTAAVTFVLVFTNFGRYLYSVGSNRKASELCGLPVRRTIVVAYASSGFMASFGGVLLAGYSGQAYLGMGDNYLLPSIAVVVIGGTSILGGKGSYVQTAAGALLITVIESALLTIGQAGQDILYGAVILLMAYFNQIATSVEGWRLGFFRQTLGTLQGWVEPLPLPRRQRGRPRASPNTSPAERTSSSAKREGLSDVKG